MMKLAAYILQLPCRLSYSNALDIVKNKRKCYIRDDFLSEKFYLGEICEISHYHDLVASRYGFAHVLLSIAVVLPMSYCL